MKAIMVGLFAALTLGIFFSPFASAVSSVVLSQLQTGDVSSASNEAVEIYNNSTVDQDITDWCLRYTTFSSVTLQSSPKYCFTSTDAQTKVFLSTHSYAVIVTTGYIMASGISPDGRFSGSGMALAGGHIRLVDASSTLVDILGWGTAQFAEGYVAGLNLAPTAPNSSQSLMRKVALAPVLQDTDNNKADFEIKVSSLRSGGIYEVRTAIDLCPVLPDIQETLPSGYGYDEAGDCGLLSLDVCSNIALIQLVLPADRLSDGLGGCYVDVCPNIDGLQQSVPAGYKSVSEVCQKLEDRELWISEVLPNVSGADTGHEYVEIYNPNDEAVVLDGYTLRIGKTLEDVMQLSVGGSTASIPAHGYITYRDSDLGFTLLNTESSLQLSAPAGNVVSYTSYSEAADDQSWSFVGGEWIYTNQLTPGSENLPMLLLADVPEVAGVTTSLQPCTAGKYRHPITNRCRNIESDTALLVACDTDEYRNPETNRCRKTATLAAILTPCNDGYERNPETNRCRKLTSTASSLVPCLVGYERNVETNRCRKVSDSLTTLATPAKALGSSSGDTLKNALIITAGLGALSYGFYEWRSELLRALRRVVGLVSGK